MFIIKTKAFALLEIILALTFAALISAALGKSLWQKLKHFSKSQQAFFEDSSNINEFIGQSLRSSCSQNKKGAFLFLSCIHAEKNKIRKLNLLLNTE